MWKLVAKLLNTVDVWPLVEVLTREDLNYWMEFLCTNDILAVYDELVFQWVECDGSPSFGESITFLRWLSSIDG